MKRWFVRISVLLLTASSIPLFYNSCQKSFKANQTGSGSTATASCKAVLEKGQLKRLDFDRRATPQAFQNRKVVLGKTSAGSGGGVQAKASASITVTPGRELGILIDNSCLQEQKSSLDTTVLSKSARDSGQLLPQLDRQVYLWVTPQSMAESEIEQLAQSEACVVGVSWNQKYEIQSSKFNDSLQGYQNHLGTIKAFGAYPYFFRPGGVFTPDGSSKVLFAVIDTGVDWRHPDLQNNMWAHSNGIGIDISTLGSSNVDYNPFDISNNGHGTHVAGLIAAVSNNSVGVIGTMPYRGRIMAVRTFVRDSSGNMGTTSQYFFNSVRFAYQNGADVINLSLGALNSEWSTDTLAEAAIDEAVQSGAVVVTVIGNSSSGESGSLVDGVNLSSIPGQFAEKSGVIGVGSIDAKTGSKSWFSHYSPVFAEIAAPGAYDSNFGIYSTLPTSMGSYGRLAGTSQAAPLVSAAAGLTIGLIRAAYGNDPSPQEVERLILKSAIKSAGLTSYFKDGNQLDLLSLVQTINAEYPNTALGDVAPAPAATCPN